MQDRLELRARVGIGEHVLAQAARSSVPSAAKKSGPNASAAARARRARRGQRMRQAIGVGDLDTKRGERLRHRRFAAADAAVRPITSAT
jgi:hypothetical protein